MSTRKITELRKQAYDHHDQYKLILAQIETLKEEAKKTCKHTKTKIVQNHYMEEGRMSGPIRWEEKVCTKCEKVLATRSEQTTMSEWSDKK